MVAFALLVRLTTGLVLLSGGIAKLQHPRSFVEAISSYRLIPKSLTKLSAYAVIGAELAIGSALLLGLFLPVTVAAGAALLSLFAAAAASVVARGMQLECGCLGRMGGLRIGRTTIVTNLVLASSVLASIGKPTIAAPLGTHSQHGEPAEMVVISLLAVLLTGTYWLSFYAPSVASRIEEAITIGNES